jgi:hypothetical protein
MNSQVLWPCVCVAVGVCVLVCGFVLRKKLKATESWPKTTGVITESSVQSEWVRAGSGREYIVSPKVVYEYQVEGRKYHCSNLAYIENNSANANSAQRKAEKYPVGQPVEVHYNPRNPEYAILKVGDPTNGALPFGMMIVGMIAVIFGIVWIKWFSYIATLFTIFTP